MVRPNILSAAFAAALLLGGCVYSDETDGNDAAGDAATSPAPSAAAPAPAPQPAASALRLEVDLSAREVLVFRGDSLAERHRAAVGSREWPTPTGEWTIGQVVFNPRWIPPQEAWARDAEEQEPGDPDNPLGRAQLVYDAPNSIHGTNEPESLGKAVSHGSIRVANDVAVKLAKQVMEAGGAARDSTWFRQVQQDSTRREEVAIPNPVPIRVVESRTDTLSTTGRTGHPPSSGDER